MFITGLELVKPLSTHWFSIDVKAHVYRYISEMERIFEKHVHINPKAVIFLLNGSTSIRKPSMSQKKRSAAILRYWHLNNVTTKLMPNSPLPSHPSHFWIINHPYALALTITHHYHYHWHLISFGGPEESHILSIWRVGDWHVSLILSI